LLSRLATDYRCPLSSNVAICTQPVRVVADNLPMNPHPCRTASAAARGVPLGVRAWRSGEAVSWGSL